MSLPFSHDQFLDVFGAYNAALWPAAAALWLATAALLGALALRRAPPRLVAALLALQWLWAGAVYHLGYFRAINPAALGFGILFLAEGGGFAWLALRRTPPEFSWGRAPRQIASALLCAYALLYPALALFTGLAWPRFPSFGVPCPADILTIGLLLAADPSAPRALGVVPLAWAAIGGSAAIVLGVRPDIMLLVAGAVLLARLAAPRRSGAPRAA